MRVERFALFFPPLIVKMRTGETEYGIGAIPLGGYVKITGMNPEEELPPDVAPRAYYHQPVWKRIVVIGAGPADEPADRVPDPVRPRVRRVARSPRRWSRSPTTLRPRASCSRATGSSPSTASGRAKRRRGSADDVPRPDLEPPLRRQARCDGCLARDAGRASRSSATARIVTVRVRPRYDAERSARSSGSRSASRATRPCSRRPTSSVDQMWAVTKGTVEAIVADLQPRAARADLGRRRQLRGDAAGFAFDDVRRALRCWP